MELGRICCCKNSLINPKPLAGLKGDKMNQERRTKLQEVIDALDEIIIDEQEAYDNMPEGMQEFEKGETMEEGLDNLNEAKDLLEESIL